MSELSAKDREKLNTLKEAIDDLEGVMIPFNIIRQNIVPVRNWLEEVLRR